MTDSIASVPRVLMIDNRDSFVFNLVDELRRYGADVRTVRSSISLEAMDHHLTQFDPDLVVLSPGPGRPDEDGNIMVPWLRSHPVVPVLGICLGHQAMGVAYGGQVARAPEPVHGRTSTIELRPDPLFEGLGPSFVAARYHSLVVTELPACMMAIGTTREHGHDLIMAMRHRTLPQLGLQFHPESVLTPHGGRLLRRFVLEALRTHRATEQPAS